MADDFNTALAISHLFAVAKDVNVYYNDVVNHGKAFDAKNFVRVRSAFADMTEIIGVLEKSAAKRTRKGMYRRKPVMAKPWVK